MNKVFCKFPELHSKVSLHLVEVSPALSEMQEKTLTGRLLDNHQDQEKRQESVTDGKSQSSKVQSKISLNLKRRVDSLELYHVGIQTGHMLTQ